MNSIKQYPRNPLLKNFIDHIYFVPDRESEGDFEIVMPDCMTELVISLSGTSERNTGSGKVEQTSNSHFVGIKSCNHYLKLGNTLKKVGVRFKPGAVPFFTNFKLEEITDGTIDASELFSKQVFELEAKLGELNDLNYMVKTVEDFMLARFITDRNGFEVLNIVKFIYNNPIESKIEHIRKLTGTDYKQLERKFIRYLGIHPKLFMKIVKFNFATKLISENPDKSLTQIAYESGYFDQSHFTKTFKELAGIKPKEYFPFSSIKLAGNQATINRLF